MKKLLRIILATLLTPFIMATSILVVGATCIVTFFVGVIGGSARTIDKIIQGNVMEVNE